MIEEHAGVVDDDVDRPEATTDFVPQHERCGGIGEVRGEQRVAGARQPRQRGRGGGAVGMVVKRDAHAAAAIAAAIAAPMPREAPVTSATSADGSVACCSASA